MKGAILFILVFAQISAWSQETKAPESLGAKPIISINGISCNILNQTFSCVPRVCDPISIVAGDSVEFCTVSQISLNSDTNYWMRWEFSGSSSHPIPVWDSFPTDTPFCHNVTWLSPGNYMIHIYYNGWLSAYPWSDCWVQGPSHWIVNVQVSATGITEIEDKKNGLFFPNPSTGSLSFVPKWANERKCNLVVYNILSQKVVRNISFDPFASIVNVETGDLADGMYLCVIEGEDGTLYWEKVSFIK